MLLSTSNDEVTTAAEELGEALYNAQREQSQSQFNALLTRCNDVIDREIGIDYDSACGADDDCC